MRLQIATVSKDKNITRMLLLGKVVSVKEGTGTIKNRVLNIIIENSIWDNKKRETGSKQIQIRFWNNNLGNFMHDRAIAANIVTGIPIMIDTIKLGNRYFAKNFALKSCLFNFI